MGRIVFKFYDVSASGNGCDVDCKWLQYEPGKGIINIEKAKCNLFKEDIQMSAIGKDYNKFIRCKPCVNNEMLFDYLKRSLGNTILERLLE